MATNMNDIKNHPGFLAFGASNVKMNKEETQSERDNTEDSKESEKDTNKKG